MWAPGPSRRLVKIAHAPECHARLTAAVRCEQAAASRRPRTMSSARVPSHRNDRLTETRWLPSSPNGLPRLRVVEIQRARMLAAAVDTVADLGYARLGVAHVVSRARVSRKTFYDVFTDREDCFLAAFENALTRTFRLAPKPVEAYPSRHRSARDPGGQRTAATPRLDRRSLPNKRTPELPLIVSLRHRGRIG